MGGWRLSGWMEGGWMVRWVGRWLDAVDGWMDEANNIGCIFTYSSQKPNMC